MADTQTLTYLIKFIADTKGANVTKAETDKLSASFNKLGIDATKVSRILNSQVVSSLNKQGDVIQKQIVTFRDLSGKIVTTTVDMNDFGRVTRATSSSTLPLIENISRLASRAALTIPLWLALRGAFVSTIGTFNNTVESIVKLDEALKNAQNEIQGTRNLPEFMERLKKAANGLSAETGTGPEKIVESFRQFATAGIDAETSLAGMNTAVKGSIATMGDSVELARLLADVYNQMGDKITEVSGAQNKFNFILSTVATLMPSNTFSVKEFGDALTNFIGTAKAANLTLDQTFAVVASSATAMQRGARGGSQLASAFSQLSVKSKEIQQFLGKPITGLSQFDVFFQTLQKAAEIGKATGEIPSDIQEIFGLKGGKVVKADVAGLEHFVDELSRLSKLSPDERMAQLLERYGTATQKIALQLDRLKQVREELGRTFVQGVTGGDNFAQTLDNINDGLLKLDGTVKVLGQSVGVLINLLGTLAVAGALRGVIGGVSKLGTAVKLTGGAVGASVGGAVARGGAIGLSPVAKAGAGVSALGVTAGIGAGLAAVQLSLFIKELAKLPVVGKAIAFAFNPITLAISGAILAVKHLSDVSKKEITKQEEIDKTNQSAFEDFLRTNDLLRVRKGLEPARPDLADSRFQESFTGIKTGFVATSDEQKTISQTILDIRQDTLKTQGVLNSEVLKDIELTKQKLGITNTELEKTIAKLKIEQELTKEKRLQGRLGNDSLKLFDIAKTQGVEIAKQIGDVLSGATNLSTFVRRGGPAVDTFKAEFGDLFKQKQAEEFFKGNRIGGFQELQGGSRINIAENLTGRDSGLRDPRIEQLIAESNLINLKQRTAENQFTDATFTNATFSNLSPKQSTSNFLAEQESRVGGRRQNLKDFEATQSQRAFEDKINKAGFDQTQIAELSTQIASLKDVIQSKEFGLDGSQITGSLTFNGDKLVGALKEDFAIDLGTVGSKLYKAQNKNMFGIDG